MADAKSWISSFHDTDPDAWSSRSRIVQIHQAPVTESRPDKGPLFRFAEEPHICPEAATQYPPLLAAPDTERTWTAWEPVDQVKICKMWHGDGPQIIVIMHRNDKLLWVQHHLHREQEQLSAITALAGALLKADPDRIRARVRSAFEAARDEVFEDGMESGLSRELEALVAEKGTAAVGAIAELVLKEKVEPEAASEALRCLGQMEHASSYLYRRQTMEKSLSSLAAIVRDGAALGLASMDDPRAIPYLEKAIEKEELDYLRKNLMQVLEQLKETRRASSSKKG